MQKIKIGVSGLAGSFSEEAAVSHCFKNNIDNYELFYLETVANVLSAVNNDMVDKGVFPIENSNGGLVLEAIEAMSKFNFLTESYFNLDVHHQLIVKDSNIKPEDIVKIVSHPQGLAQCRTFLKKEFPNAQIEEYSDTAAAVEALSFGKFPNNYAVIGSQKSANIYELYILKKDINDLKFNTTTFIVCSKRLV
jgi:prephenate dehydratase